VVAKKSFKQYKYTLEEVAKNFDGLDLEKILIPSDKLNYAALKKFDITEVIKKYVKKTKEKPIIYLGLRRTAYTTKKLELLLNIVNFE
jgi:hypothetical protein